MVDTGHRVNRREMLASPSRVFARKTRPEPSARANSPPWMGSIPRLSASRAKLQGAEQVGVGQGKGGIPVLPGLGQQVEMPGNTADAWG